MGLQGNEKQRDERVVKMPSETCTATREAMRKEDEVGDGLEAIAHKSEKENTTCVN